MKKIKINAKAFIMVLFIQLIEIKKNIWPYGRAREDFLTIKRDLCGQKNGKWLSSPPILEMDPYILAFYSISLKKKKKTIPNASKQKKRELSHYQYFKY